MINIEVLEAIRKQILASPSPTLHTWDESWERIGTLSLQGVIKYISSDIKFSERLKRIAERSNK
jgi:hypothetical protein